MLVETDCTKARRRPRNLAPPTMACSQHESAGTQIPCTSHEGGDSFELGRHAGNRQTHKSTTSRTGINPAAMLEIFFYDQHDINHLPLEPKRRSLGDSRNMMPERSGVESYCPVQVVPSTPGCIVTPGILAAWLCHLYNQRCIVRQLGATSKVKRAVAFATCTE
ncbi:hypothetical protein BKA81DRAFT_72562 [Phyllosticta paracitricarpa]